MSEAKVLTHAFLKEILTDTLFTRSWCSDLDTCRQAGIYSVKEDAKNLPPGAYRYGSLIVGMGNYFHFQVFKPSHTTVLYWRLGGPTTWEEWYKFSGEKATD